MSIQDRSRAGLALLAALGVVVGMTRGQDEDRSAQPPVEPAPVPVDSMLEPDEPVRNEPAMKVPPPSPFVVQLKAGVWVPRFGGALRLGPGPSFDDAGVALHLDDLEPTPNAELTLRKIDHWLLRGSFATYDTSGQGVADEVGTFGAVSLAPGDPFEASLEIDTVSFEAGGDLFHPYVAERDGGTDLRFTMVAGARWVRVDTSLTEPGVATQSAVGEWIVVSLGIELTLRHEPPTGLALGRAFEIGAGFAAGPGFGGEGGSAWQVRADITWEPVHDCGFMFGYRLLELNLESDDGFEVAGGLQGLYAGIELRF